MRAKPDFFGIKFLENVKICINICYNKYNLYETESEDAKK